jgi:hypothetical protein
MGVSRKKKFGLLGSRAEDEAQHLTKIVYQSGSYNVNKIPVAVASTYLCKFEERFSFPGTV